jgi:sec-independent protein translocase protein TatA
MYQGVLLEFLNMGGSEITLILVAALLLFGGKKLPELAKGLGKGIREFKDASEGVKREIHRNINAMDIDKELADEENHTSNETFHPSNDYYGSGESTSDGEVNDDVKPADTAHNPETKVKEDVNSTHTS